MILVTGGAGFIGSHLVHRLLEENLRVRVLDNFETGSRRNLGDVISDVEVLEGDLRSEDDVRKAVDGAELVFHQAALGSVPQSISDPATTFDVNVIGTLKLMIAARNAGVRRVIFASSSAVYGENPKSPKTEELLPQPMSPYAASKLSGEHLMSVYSEILGTEAVSLRYFNVFGPRQDPHSAYAAVIPSFVQALKSGERPVIFGDGEQRRSFVFATDVVEANLRAAEFPGVGGKVFNIGGSRSHSINQVLGLIQAAMGTSLEPIFLPTRPGDIRESVAGVERAEEELRFHPEVSFELGISKTVTALLEQRD